jgi:hypothetical protein
MTRCTQLAARVARQEALSFICDPAFEAFPVFLPLMPEPDGAGSPRRR